MSITDELRKWGRATLADTSLLVRMEAIADRIDAEHERAMADAYLSGTPTDEKLTELGWIRMPKDADDVPWNLGDRDEDGNEVIALKLASDGWFVITDGEWLHRPGKRHYHEPTVEDVLREFSEKMNENLGMYTGEAIDADEWRQADSKTIAEYAAKLRLAEGEDA